MISHPMENIVKASKGSEGKLTFRLSLMGISTENGNTTEIINNSRYCRFRYETIQEITISKEHMVMMIPS
jgi:hypothetical protein